ncbi:bile acid:sodium symporter family protein [Larkinella bovis]|uniref:Bile acid:sodium symporter family protein n=1 Tax=Larkinella bovis TaxID=683041 RepID=A0ABW0IJP4_9BACT
MALLGMIGLAYLWPEPGIQKGPFSLDNLANIGVSVIFFFYGLRLSGDKLRVGLSNWKLHLTIHLTTFVLFPLLILAGMAVFETDENRLLWLGAFYVAALPSTVSSSVVMVSIAGGNLPAAIFNASISSLIGVFITPLWMGLLLSTSSGDYDLGSVIAKLSLQVIAPVVLGILLNRWLGAWAERYKKALGTFDKVVILMIVYTSFCDSFERRMFQGLTFWDLLELGGYMLGLFFLVYGLVNLVSKWLGFNRADRITALFCGSKKSLVQGSVMVNVLFPGNVVGIVLLPIMMYHALQLIAASALAQSLARRT